MSMRTSDYPMPVYEPALSPSLVEQKLKQRALCSRSRKSSGAGQTLRFLDFPAEVRFLIYEAAFEDGYGSIDRFLDRYIHDCASGKHRNSAVAPEPRLKLVTPTVLLLNREIYHEAIRFLRRKPLVFSHGLLGFELTSLISEDTLLSIPHIIITDTGHEPQSEFIHRSLDGFKALTRGLMYFLRDRNRALQSFEVNLQNPGMADHIRWCYATYPAHSQCETRKVISVMYQSLKCLREIPSVTIRGWLPDLIARDLERLMISPRNPIVELPEHIRRKIFRMCMDWNQASDVLARCNAVSAPAMTRTPHKYTPNIFLIDRTLWSEATRLMWDTPFNLTLTDTPKKGADNIFDFICPYLVLKIRHLRIEIQHWTWLGLVQQIMHFIRIRGGALLSLALNFTDDVIRPVCARLGHYYPTNELAEMFLPLYTMRGLSDVLITGSLPECFAGPLARTMMMGWEGRAEALVQEKMGDEAEDQEDDEEDDEDDDEDDDNGAEDHDHDPDVVVCGQRRIFSSLMC